MNRYRIQLGRRFARLATNSVVRRPRLWGLFRGRMGRQFDRLAPDWDTIVSPGHLAAFETALASVAAPTNVLDIGTGTGSAALAVARRFPDAEVVGVDLAEGMIAAARTKLPPALAGRVTYRQADASRLPFDDDEFDLVTLANMIPFFDELARVVSADGSVLVSYSSGPKTPIYVPTARLREELERRGFVDFEEFAADPATAFLARRQKA